MDSKMEQLRKLANRKITRAQNAHLTGHGDPEVREVVEGVGKAFVTGYVAAMSTIISAIDKMEREALTNGPKTEDIHRGTNRE